MKLFFVLMVTTLLSLSFVSVSSAETYNGMTFGDYPTWADEAFAPQGN